MPAGLSEGLPLSLSTVFIALLSRVMFSFECTDAGSGSTVIHFVLDPVLLAIGGGTVEGNKCRNHSSALLLESTKLCHREGQGIPHVAP